jgi:hypothetical protein
MHWYTKIVTYRLAWLILNELEISASAKPICETVQSSRSGGGRTFLEWATDFRSCIEEQPEMDRHYLNGEAVCKRTPRSIWRPNKLLWKRVQERGLDRQGDFVRSALWGKVA